MAWFLQDRQKLGSIFGKYFGEPLIPHFLLDSRSN
jgi:hypothetical protein